MADIRITGRMVNFSRLTFDTNDLDHIRQQLIQLLATDDYTGTLVIIDSSVTQELIALIQLLIEFKLQPMAVIDGLLGDDARAIQFPVLPPDQPVQRIKATSKVVQQPTPSTEPTAITETEILVPVSTAQHATIYHDEILRTGQSLVEDNGDIILTASMNSGSEVIASGNIFIYGTARGRVIAGASGEQTARIFCQSLEAELISIAGTYCVADDIPKEYLKQAVQIHLNNNQELEFALLSI
ncbi:septum site-determining protein MinC [Acinetobacter qingfengensis]|uniref:Probable septum site-determining protein MinC n=1 Tax=Acinetobacter qingfengensis TaxID=1262585 RepID=A0A1E7RC18_9GAMM|nr:septum site-determining protein MinC [Acinetobacter qingfengensis]KAA8735084.1 septum site-determining protein MinC [Acinetobacter qingfengensis]OEY96999.1 septum site-determining protein MinC [Acinetobacter qingfengensis]